MRLNEIEFNIQWYWSLIQKRGRGKPYNDHSRTQWIELKVNMRLLFPDIGNFAKSWWKMLRQGLEEEQYPNSDPLSSEVLSCQRLTWLATMLKIIKVREIQEEKQSNARSRIHVWMTRLAWHSTIKLEARKIYFVMETSPKRKKQNPTTCRWF